MTLPNLLNLYNPITVFKVFLCMFEVDYQIINHCFI